MTRCKEFYEKFKREGNFCEKNPSEAMKILRYIDYCKQYNLTEGDISFNALIPLMNIEGTQVHDETVREIRSMIKRQFIKSKDITRRMVMNTIRRVNAKYANSPENYLNLSSNNFRMRITLEFVNEETLDKWKKYRPHFKNNDSFLTYMIGLYEREQIENYEAAKVNHEDNTGIEAIN